jgi:thiol-disulfide isomerase/thioredoxin
MTRATARFALSGLVLLASLPLSGAAGAAGASGTGLNYIVPVAAGSVEDPNTRPPMPNLTVSDGTDVAIPLSHFRGGVLLINFWATWCAPCIKEMVYLDRLQGDMKGLPVLVMPVSEDKGGLPVAKGFMTRQKLTFLKTYTDPGAAAAQVLNVTGLPTSYIVDKKGRLVQRVEGPFEWDSPQIKARFLELAHEAP